MGSWALLVLSLLGFLCVEPGFGQRGDVDVGEWMRAQEKLTKDLQENQRHVETQQKDLEALEARLNATVDELTGQKADMDKLKEENKDLQTRLNASEMEIDKLKQSGGKAAPQIAFSASLSNSGEIYSGPCTDKSLIFKRVFSNTGDAYDQNTGIFTAPVGGSYFFSFSTYGYNTHVMGAMLMKNGLLQISTHESPTADGSDSSSNSVVLRLAAGDKVHVELWDNGRVFDNLNGHTTFSGFLLFPM
ncbi:complement C1q-like protein 4 isoform X1 [Hippoglossus stenolepis]|uniref:complement C1q-like protein 4 isoform X1 n=1 Tax=Hippoglossus stenolepis TaxID=195615 RepID=UPI001FAFB432|nr:complement C1q-like protein 4 isoform X1 [Hippoglossus stenolepis]